MNLSKIAQELRDVASTLEQAADGWPEELKEGRFTAYCKRMGFDGPGIGCAQQVMQSADSSVRGMATFYMNTVKPEGKTLADIDWPGKESSVQSSLSDNLKQPLRRVWEGIASDLIPHLEDEEGIWDYMRDQMSSHVVEGISAETYVSWEALDWATQKDIMQQIFPLGLMYSR